MNLFGLAGTARRSPMPGGGVPRGGLGGAMASRGMSMDDTGRLAVSKGMANTPTVASKFPVKGYQPSMPGVAIQPSGLGEMLLSRLGKVGGTRFGPAPMPPNAGLPTGDMPALPTMPVAPYAPMDPNMIRLLMGGLQ